jgi:hypothetical protein
MAAYQPALVVPPSFEPLVPPLPTPTVPPRFVPRAALITTVVPHVAQAFAAVPRAATPTPDAPRVTAAPPMATDGPPPREWSSSPIVYTKQPQQPTPSAPMGPASTTHDQRHPIVVPVTPPVNPQ